MTISTPPFFFQKPQITLLVFEKSYDFNKRGRSGIKGRNLQTRIDLLYDPLAFPVSRPRI